MNKQIASWRLIHSSIIQQVPVMLLYVLQSKGSSPGRQGFFMAVSRNGEMEGSIGGGIMEHKFVEMAKEHLMEEAELHEGPMIRKQVHDKSAAKNQSGMICSGEQINYFYRMQAADLENVENLLRCMEENKPGWLILSPLGFSFSEKQSEVNNYHFDFRSEEDWLYKEKIGFKNRLYIIGGGHCALALSKIMSLMDFHIHLYDTRPGLHTMMQNNYAHEKHTINEYTELQALIPPGSENFVVIMTFGYRTDEVAVRALLSKHFCYFGLLGSKNKIKILFADLIDKGCSPEELNRIDAPAGIPINSQTPEEIAISIAARIIEYKNTFAVP